MKNVLLGVVCLDIYTRTNVVRPGCGILHNAFHLQQLGSNPLLITRIGQRHAETFNSFFHRHHISILENFIVGYGKSASIEIDIEPSGEAVMSNYVRGVWENFQLNNAEELQLAQAENLHLVLADGVAPEFLRISQNKNLENVLVSADFLSFRDFTIHSFTRLLNHVDIAFIGWKGNLTDPTIDAIAQAAAQCKALVVVTLGKQGIQVFNSLTTGTLQTRFFNVQPVTAQQNTNGCGDAFISWFLADYWQHHNIEQAIHRGKIGGKQATQWQFALPNFVY